LFYEQDGVLYLLAGTQNAQPNNVFGSAKKYRIFLKAGVYGDDPDQSKWENSPEKQAEGGYSIPPAANTPPGAKQFFRLISKTPHWYSFGPKGREEPYNGNSKDNWGGVNYFNPGLEASIDGTISVRLKPDLTYQPGDVVTVNDTSGFDNANEVADGKGRIVGAELQKIKAVADVEGAVLRVSCTARVVSADANTNATFSGGGSTQPGWGIGAFGTDQGDKLWDQEWTISIGVPNRIELGESSWDVDILIDDILSAANPDDIFVNVNNGGKINNMQIFTPVPSLITAEMLADLLEELGYKKLLELLDEYGYDALKALLDELIKNS
jgi:hypothetical protein